MIGPARTRVALDDTVDRAVVERILTFSPLLHVTDYLELADDEQALETPRNHLARIYSAGSEIA